MKNIANDAALAKLENRPMSIDTEDHELYEALTALELHIFRARIEFIVNGERTTKFKQHLTDAGEIYAKIKTIMGCNPPSTGSRRARLRDFLPGRMFCGDPRASGKLGSGGRQGAAPGTGMGNADRSEEGSATRQT